MEARQFRIHPNVIHSIIGAQAGTLDKAFLELIMNSIDAESSRVDISISAEKFSVTDDGRGFQSRQDIESYFEVFGFPHDGAESANKTYGAFGIGRGQIWAFASTLWRTATFEMNVDIKGRGLDYHLREELPYVKGCSISGSFYEPLLPSDIDRTVRELFAMTRFAQIDVFVNDRLVSIDPKKEQWDVVTDDAYILLNSSRDLKVYNLGVLVRGYAGHYFGTGGIVVSKKRLQVNFARNDVLVSKCNVWKRIKQYLQNNSKQQTTRKPVLTDDERLYLIDRIRANELDVQDVENAKIFQDTTGKYWTFSKLDPWINDDLTLTISPDYGSRLAEKIHLEGIAFVFNHGSLEQFDCRNVDEFVRTIRSIYEFTLRNSLSSDSKDDTVNHRLRHFDQNFRILPFKQYAASLDDDFSLVEKKKLSQKEQIALEAISEHHSRIIQIAARFTNLILRERSILAGVSDTADAWTDGSTYIAINKNRLSMVSDGYSGFMYLCHLLLHEYLHDDVDTQGHLHDMTFYQNYHDAILFDGRWNEYGRADYFSKDARDMMVSYIYKLRRKGIRTSRACKEDEDREALQDMMKP